ncbi:MAG TPA: ABC transporter permease [Thermomicrobiales bacterium]|nr:ABC transporter permease [Thermomicrobiales bacterium]
MSTIRKQRGFLRRLIRHRMAFAGLIVLIFMILAAFLTPYISPYDSEAMQLTEARKPPSLQHPLGTDKLGRDTLTRVFVGGRVSIMVALSAVAISTLIGTVLGVAAGYLGGWTDIIISRITDVFLSFPLFVLLIMLVSMIGPSLLNVVLILGLFGWMVLTRVVRSQVMMVMNEPYIEAARAAGATHIQIVFRQILPNSFVPIVVTSTIGIANAMLSEAALSFLGLGVQPPIPSWGNMLNAAQSLQVLVNEPWVWIGPGAAIAITVLSINFVGDGLSDALDPHSHG